MSEQLKIFEDVKDAEDSLKELEVSFEKDTVKLPPAEPFTKPEIQEKITEVKRTYDNAFKIPEDLTLVEPTTGTYPMTVDPSNRLSIIDDIDLDLKYVTESNARVWRRLTFFRAKIQSDAKKIYDLELIISQMTGSKRPPPTSLHPSMEGDHITSDYTLPEEKKPLPWLYWALVIAFAVMFSFTLAAISFIATKL